jgi:prephenate dehydrogenase
MGRWTARYLLKEGMQVVISGRNPEKLKTAARELGVSACSNIEAVKQADVVLLSVSPDQVEAVVREIAPHIRPDQVVMDNTSVKTRPVEAMHRHIKEALILGTHPVFGPGARNLENQNIVLTPVSEREKAFVEKVKNYLESKKARVSVMSPEEHDRVMTVVLGLAHFIAIVSADTLLSFDNFAEMKKIGGTTFKLLYTLVESVISEDPGLYASLQVSFPDMGAVEGAFVGKSASWAEMVGSGDREGFARRMAALHAKLEKTDPSFRKAYENMYRVTDSL